MSKRKEVSRLKELEVMNPNVAGIDIGSKVHYVCVPEGRDKECVKSFESFTENLNEMAEWLKKCGITSVVMESTSVYWIPVYQILRDQGLMLIL